MCTLHPLVWTRCLQPEGHSPQSLSPRNTRRQSFPFFLPLIAAFPSQLAGDTQYRKTKVMAIAQDPPTLLAPAERHLRTQAVRTRWVGCGARPSPPPQEPETSLALLGRLPGSGARRPGPRRGGGSSAGPRPPRAVRDGHPAALQVTLPRQRSPQFQAPRSSRPAGLLGSSERANTRPC